MVGGRCNDCTLPCHDDPRVPNIPNLPEVSVGITKNSVGSKEGCLQRLHTSGLYVYTVVGPGIYAKQEASSKHPAPPTVMPCNVLQGTSLQTDGMNRRCCKTVHS